MSLSIRLHAADDVVIARQQLLSGSIVEDVAVRGLVPPGHKLAMRHIAAGEPVRRYNQIIGFASQAIAPGEHVHTHNLNMGPDKGSFERDYAFGADIKPDAPSRHATFMGYVRPDGRVATRNFIGILSSVNCSATVSRAIADHFSRLTNPAALADYPQVDGVIALTHGTGCGTDQQCLAGDRAQYAVDADMGGQACTARNRDVMAHRCDAARIDRPVAVASPADRRVVWHRAEAQVAAMTISTCIGVKTRAVCSSSRDGLSIGNPLCGAARAGTLK